MKLFETLCLKELFCMKNEGERTIFERRVRRIDSARLLRQFIIFTNEEKEWGSDKRATKISVKELTAVSVSVINSTFE